MISHNERQRLMARLNDAEAHPRAVLAKCVAGLVVVAGLGAAAVFAPQDEQPAQAAAQEVKQAAPDQHRREVFEGRRAYYEAGQRASDAHRAAAR
ncbi:MAG: hypothetical protein ACREUW_12300 [Burkholderiales bacterium]